MSHHHIYKGIVYHGRLTPVCNKFRYRVFSLLVDIDHLPSLNMRLLKANRFHIWSFYNRDHGDHSNNNLRHWVEKQLNFTPDKITLMCFPRLFGYVFNPISVFFCYKNNHLDAVIYEVRNAYKHQHCYVQYINDQQNIEHNISKKFYVSPYTPSKGEYKMQLQPPVDLQYHLKITLYDQHNKLILVTDHKARQVELSNKTLIKYFFIYLGMPFKISSAILWQALKLRLKGMRFQKPHV